MAAFFSVFGDNLPSTHAFAHGLKLAPRGPDAFAFEKLLGYQNCYLMTHESSSPTKVSSLHPLRISKFPHLTLLCDGAVYNSSDLANRYNFDYETASSVEAIIHLYEKFGPKEAAGLIDGEFAFVLLDVHKGHVVFSRDPFGIKPLFALYTADGMLSLASEMKAIVYPEKLSDAHYIQEVLPAHYGVYKLEKNGKTTPEICEKYTNFVDLPRHSKLNHGLVGYLETTTVYESIKSNIRLLLEDAVRKRIPKDASVINCLSSGGLDSTLIAGLLHKIIKTDGLPITLKTFTVGMEGSPDLENSKLLVEHIGSEHSEVLYTLDQALALLEPLVYILETYDISTIRASLPMFMLAKHIKDTSSSKYLMCGEGSDEVTQGYIYFKKAPSPQEAHEESIRLLEEVYKFDVIRCDRNTAANGLTIFAPFLDHTFVSYYLSLPPELRVPRDGIEKYLLRDAFSGTGLIPDKLLWRPKEAFSDGVSPQNRSWGDILREHFDSAVSDAELDDAPKKFPYFAPTTKESYYYRCLFEKLFPKCERVVSYYWLPKWVEGEDPSSRSWSNYGH